MADEHAERAAYNIITSGSLSKAGRDAIAKRQQEIADYLGVKVETLSAINHRVLPLKYQRAYKLLLARDPIRAAKFFSIWSFTPKNLTMSVTEIEKKMMENSAKKAGEALMRVQRGNELKRRV